MSASVSNPQIRHSPRWAALIYETDADTYLDFFGAYNNSGSLPTGTSYGEGDVAEEEADFRRDRERIEVDRDRQVEKLRSA